MKCPYRKKTTTKNVDDSVTYEDFMDCYKEECPFYYKGKYSGTQEEYEECEKVSVEIRG